jgi:hypothetical protein
MGRWVVKLDFVGANPEVKPEGRELMPAVISYFKGPREEWRTGLKTYGSVIYRDLWPGIDLIYAGTVNRLKYSFLVKSGADPERIRLAYRGVSSLSITDAGQLEVQTPVRGFQDDRPVSYQEVEGRAVEVRTAYAVKTDAGEGARVYGFEVGDYDRSKLLVLDPAVLVYCGYIGGGGGDGGTGIAVDGDGNAYVTGATRSAEETFPVAGGPDLSFNEGRADAFVAKVVVGPEPPAKPTGPAPANAAANVCTNPVLSWSGDGTATSYDVYFGNDSTPDSGELRGNQTNTQFRPGRLGPNTTYYWRVDAKNQSGTTTGDVWSFTTGSKPCMQTMPWMLMLLGD